MTRPDLDQFARRVIAEALLDGSRIWWTRRAAAFQWAAPRPGDFVGGSTLEERRDQWRRCHASAQACRSKGAFVGDFDRDTTHAEVDRILDRGAA